MENINYEGPTGFIQWKGTDVCMDVYCKCGYHSHIDSIRNKINLKQKTH